MGTAAKLRPKLSSEGGEETQHVEAGHSSAETKKRKRQDQPGPLTACQTHMHAHTHCPVFQNSHEEKGKTSTSVFHAVIYRKSKVERVNLLALRHKRSWNEGQFTSQSICSEGKGKKLHREWQQSQKQVRPRSQREDL